MHLPETLTFGTWIGRWIDPHNARPAYHYIMMRALAELVSVMPNDHPEFETIRNSLLLGLKCRNLEMLDRGIMNKDHAIETLIFVHHAFQGDTAFLTESRTDDALNAIGRRPPLSLWACHTKKRMEFPGCGISHFHRPFLFRFSDRQAISSLLPRFPRSWYRSQLAFLFRIHS